MTFIPLSLKISKRELRNSQVIYLVFSGRDRTLHRNIHHKRVVISYQFGWIIFFYMFMYLYRLVVCVIVYDLLFMFYINLMQQQVVKEKKTE